SAASRRLSRLEAEREAEPGAALRRSERDLRLKLARPAGDGERYADDDEHAADGPKRRRAEAEIAEIGRAAAEEDAGQDVGGDADAGQDEAGEEHAAPRAQIFVERIVLVRLVAAGRAPHRRAGDDRDLAEREHGEAAAEQRVGAVAGIIRAVGE